MFRKTLITAAVVAAAAGAAAVAKYVTDRKNAKSGGDEDDDDNEVHFIKIDDEDEDSDDADDVPSYDLSGKSEQVQEVCGVYPYLNPDFVEEMLGRKDEFNSMFEEDTLVSIVHSVSFEKHENLEQFLDIMETAGYTCVQTENKEMTCTRKVFIEDGAILSDILNVANQTAALHGKYLGQKVTA